MAQHRAFDGALLQQAIQATFAARGRAFTPELPTILTPAFAEDAQKQRQWTAFLAAKSAESAPVSLAEALAPAIRLLAPLWQAINAGQPFSGLWDTAAGEWRAAPADSAAAPVEMPAEAPSLETTPD